MTLLGPFFHRLWHDMPLWLLLISAWILVDPFSLAKTPGEALILSGFIILILLLTSVVMSALKRVDLFKHMAGKKDRVLSVGARVLVFYFLAVTMVTVVEFVYQGFNGQQPLNFGVYLPHTLFPCLVLSRYGAIPTHHTVKETMISSVSTGFGFGVFMVFLGWVSALISRYWPELGWLWPVIIDAVGWILIVVSLKIMTAKETRPVENTGEVGC